MDAARTGRTGTGKCEVNQQSNIRGVIQSLAKAKNTARASQTATPTHTNPHSLSRLLRPLVAVDTIRVVQQAVLRRRHSPLATLFALALAVGAFLGRRLIAVVLCAVQR